MENKTYQDIFLSLKQKQQLKLYNYDIINKQKEEDKEYIEEEYKEEEFKYIDPKEIVESININKLCSLL
jgi:hypothetical protein